MNVCRKDRRLAFVTEEFFDDTETSDPPPSHYLESKETSGFLLRIVATLPLRQQEVLQLRFQSDLNYQEISEITNLSVSNVGVLIHTALKTLRRRYGRMAAEFTSVAPAKLRK